MSMRRRGLARQLTALSPKHGGASKWSNQETDFGGGQAQFWPQPDSWRYRALPWPPTSRNSANKAGTQTRLPNRKRARARSTAGLRTRRATPSAGKTSATRSRKAASKNGTSSTSAAGAGRRNDATCCFVRPLTCAALFVRNRPSVAVRPCSRADIRTAASPRQRTVVLPRRLSPGRQIRSFTSGRTCRPSSI